MFKKVLASAVAFVLFLGVLCSPTLASEDRKYVFKEGPGHSTPVTDSVSVPTKDREYAMEDGPGRPSEPIEPTYPIKNPIEEPEQEKDEAVPTTATILVDGQKIEFAAYLINDNHYFKLCDMFHVLNNTIKQFEVTKSASSDILEDVPKIQFTGYLIDGQNYFKLRDIGAMFDISIDWDGTTGTILINTNKCYE